MQCPDCEYADHITDTVTGDVICLECGLVLMDHVLTQSWNDMNRCCLTLPTPYRVEDNFRCLLMDMQSEAPPVAHHRLHQDLDDFQDFLFGLEVCGETIDVGRIRVELKNKGMQRYYRSVFYIAAMSGVSESLPTRLRLANTEIWHILNRVKGLVRAFERARKDGALPLRKSFPARHFVLHMLAHEDPAFAFLTEYLRLPKLAKTMDRLHKDWKIILNYA
jgi:hypothetical protein